MFTCSLVGLLSTSISDYIQDRRTCLDYAIYPYIYIHPYHPIMFGGPIISTLDLNARQHRSNVIICTDADWEIPI